MLVVSDSDYEPSIEKLSIAGFRATLPRRDPSPELLEMLPDPAKMLRELHAQYARLDRATTTFDYPPHYNRASLQLVLIPASYAHLSASPALKAVAAGPAPSLTGAYNVHENVHYPLERVLLESFIRVLLDERDETRLNRWVGTLKVWISHMYGYLDLENDAVDDCPDDAVRDWFSQNWGRGHEARFGPMDRRVTKRLGSAIEMPCDMRGHPIATWLKSATITRDTLFL